MQRGGHPWIVLLSKDTEHLPVQGKSWNYLFDRSAFNDAGCHNCTSNDTEPDNCASNDTGPHTSSHTDYAASSADTSDNDSQ